MQQQLNPQMDVFRRRLPVVVIGLLVFSLYLVWELASFQWLPPDVATYMRNQSDANYTRGLRIAAARGMIYDRKGEALAVNTLEYEIGISPNLVTDARASATRLAALLDLNELETFEKIASSQPWVSLKRPVSAQVTQEIMELDGVTTDPIPRRSYPQGTLASQVIGFVNLDLQGHYGVEGYYQDQLAGQAREREVSSIPFDAPLAAQEADQGRDIILTIDRDIQFLAESELQRAITETGARSGTILIMDPRTGEILAMASYPSFDPNAYYEVEDPRLLVNPAISSQYEPGSVVKVLTVAAALEAGTITPQFTYFDQGSITVGGVTIQNWDRRSHGTIDATQILVQSLNVGAATVSTGMGPETFYSMMNDFGVGRLTGVDLEGEAAGMLHIPGDPDWSESQLGTNSFGQGMAMTPLQLLTSVNAIANNGLMMQPHVVQQIVDGNQVINAQPSALGRPISAQTARIVTEMMVATVRDGVDAAGVDGYTIAGKSGTAEIPSPVGYESGAWIMSFVGFLPADAPQVSMLIKLDRPTSGRFASQVAAPVFQRIAERLVIMLEIPTDDVRRVLASQGGVVDAIQY
jgi:cell division protein FtsI/penicillin-binding protein 2